VRCISTLRLFTVTPSATDAEVACARLQRLRVDIECE
jgi:hypothetical protein